MPPLTGQFVALLKETVICSVVGIPELLREALVVQSWTANPTPLIIATIGYLLLLVVVYYGLAELLVCGIQ